jgi:two-component system cell cycle response regulator DivK
MDPDIRAWFCWAGSRLQHLTKLHRVDLPLPIRNQRIRMDIQLPDTSGLEVTRRLRDDERSQRIPIVAVTTFAMGWREREAVHSGCDADISKPIEILGFFTSRFSDQF